MSIVRKVDTGAEPGWQALAEAHREAMVRSRQRAPEAVEPGAPQAATESPGDDFARYAEGEAA